MIAPLPERPGQAVPLDLQQKRDMLATAVRSGALPLPNGQSVVHIGGVRTLRFGAAAPKGGTVVHFHGGGFRQGQPEMIARYAAALAEAADVEVFCPAYRLAPDHPFPSGLNDAICVIAKLAAISPERPLFVAGDSAGGGLAAAATLLCISDGVRIAGLVLHSPWLDLTISNPCYRANAASDELFSEELATEAARQYLQGHPASHQLASPLHGDVANFPRTFISVGTGEVLYADALSYHDRLVAAGCAVEICAITGMGHVAITRDLALTGARQVMDKTVSFILRG